MLSVIKQIHWYVFMIWFHLSGLLEAASLGEAINTKFSLKRIAQNY